MRRPQFLICFVLACFCMLLSHKCIHAQTQTVINYADTWKFNIPTQDPGTSWRTSGFDDTVPLNGVSWGSGPGLFGFETTSLPYPIQTGVGSQGSLITYLFRKTFTFSGDPANATFSIDQVLDDGVAYYLNGNLIGSTRYNTGGAWNSQAHTNVGDASEEFGMVSGPAIGLINGTNVLCAEVHQNGTSSTDLVFGAKLKISPYTPPVLGDIQHVIYISVDGLRGHFIQQFIETAPSEFPGFVRLRNASAFTYNARCDYERSVTIPNHFSMLTGRPVLQPAGLPDTTHHGFDDNGPTPGHTIHANGNPNVTYKYSVYDVAHDRGFSTSLLVDKDRLTVINISYDELAGATDVIGPDNGKDKIDFAQIVDYNPPAITNTLVGRINGNTLENYTFMHFGVVDQAGHASGWNNTDGSAYRNAVKTVDSQIVAILNALESNPALTNKVALIVSADHGGGGPGETQNHSNFLSVENYTIPMFIRGPSFTPGSDLYSYFSNRANPGTGRPSYTGAFQPIRNGDAANLSTALLGLPTVPGSLMKPELKRNYSAARSNNSITMTWPVYLTGYSLEYSDNLMPGDASWTKVNTGITISNGMKIYTHTFPPPNARFFRIHQPAGN